MSPKVTRSTRTKGFVSGSQASSSVAFESSHHQNGDRVRNIDYRGMTVQDLILSIGQRNDDPEVKMMLDALSEKFQKGFSEVLEAEKRSRSLVISGIEEPPEGLRPSERRKDLESKVNDILDAIDVDCCPTEAFRIGKPGSSRQRSPVFALHWASFL
ncbi:hypothetical protein ANCDUO_04190 [Ancylostoma duodenale]|uniref:Uncharacterized protein n=1 Tax=Ancylostoma duodenale TaxID=51022 RepID=A0A0C2H1Q7_9BILA|nr:hypothetical protein ANCDUO_04190 [Ancylostoma duodenale]